MSEHISRKELKKDKIHEAIEHSAEAVYSHRQITLLILLVVLVVAVGWAGWTIYHDRQTAKASADFDWAMKIYSGRIGGTSDPSEPRDISYPDETHAPMMPWQSSLRWRINIRTPIPAGWRAITLPCVWRT